MSFMISSAAIAAAVLVVLYGVWRARLAALEKVKTDRVAARARFSQTEDAAEVSAGLRRKARPAAFGRR